VKVLTDRVASFSTLLTVYTMHYHLWGFPWHSHLNFLHIVFSKLLFPNCIVNISCKLFHELLHLLHTAGTSQPLLQSMIISVTPSPLQILPTGGFTVIGLNYRFVNCTLLV